VVIIAPKFLDMNLEKRQAINRNEVAKHEPLVSTKDSRTENLEKLKHGCGCQHRKHTSKLMFTADGNKMFPSMRPWMISH
jgi:hypothetical protein